MYRTRPSASSQTVKRMAAERIESLQFVLIWNSSRFTFKPTRFSFCEYTQQSTKIVRSYSTNELKKMYPLNHLKSMFDEKFACLLRLGACCPSRMIGMVSSEQALSNARNAFVCAKKCIPRHNSTGTRNNLYTPWSSHFFHIDFYL